MDVGDGEAPEVEVVVSIAYYGMLCPDLISTDAW
jgi:hypothetical protein